MFVVYRQCIISFLFHLSFLFLPSNFFLVNEIPARWECYVGLYIYIFYCNWYLKPTGQRPFWLKQLQCILSWWPIRRQSWVKRRPTVSVPAFLCSVYLTLYRTDITLRRKTRQQRPQPGCGVQRFQWKQGFGWGQCSFLWAHKTWCRWFLLQGQLLPVQRECYAS